MDDYGLVGNVVIAGTLTGMVYGLMALGLSVIFGVMRIINFAHGEMTTLAMYAAAIAAGAFAIDPFLAAIPLTVVFFGVGWMFQSRVVNPFIARPEHAQLMLLVAVAIVLTNVQLIAFGPDAHGVQADYQLESFELGSLLVDKARVYAAGAALLATIAMLLYFRWSLTGKAIRACADNRLGARVVGLNVERLYNVTFGLGLGCVAIAGSLLVVLFEVTPGAGPAYTLLGFVIVIVGGLGSMLGALIGGVLIGVSESVAGLIVPPSAKTMVSCALLILILIVRPHGLLGQRT